MFSNDLRFLDILPPLAKEHKDSFLTLFDPDWYASRYPDFRTSELEAIDHYIQYGALAGYDPHPLFDANWYLATYQDVQLANLNPLAHYLSSGAAEGRDPHPFFDTDWYLKSYRESIDAKTNPLIHYLTIGSSKGYAPSALFDPAWYIRRYSDVKSSCINPLIHFVRFGAEEGRDPHPAFDTEWYLAQYPNVAENKTNAYKHYVQHGATLGYNPSLFFDTQWYTSENPEVAESGLSPLAHFLSVGVYEGRRPNPIFDVDWYVKTYLYNEPERTNALFHFLDNAHAEDITPSPLFDTAWYRKKYLTKVTDLQLDITETIGHEFELMDTNLRDVQTSNSFKHYMEHGASRGYDPHPLFDADWYLTKYPDVKNASLNPLAHYISSGAAEGRDPSAYFDTDWYSMMYPQALHQGENPLSYYVLIGAKLGHAPSPLFDPEWYLEQNQDVKLTQTDPLIHYVKYGICEGRNPSPFFDSAWYLNEYPLVAASGMSPLRHFVQFGSALGYNPSVWFNTNWYRTNYPDVVASNLNPLAHFVSSGAKEGRNPNALFDCRWYMEKYPDVKEADQNPLKHFICYGAYEGRDPNPFFDSHWYVERYPELSGSGVNPLLHYIQEGAALGYNPSERFDTTWYLENNPDVHQSGSNPLGHYISAGRFEGRSPCQPNRLSDETTILDIPYEVLKNPENIEDQDVCLFVTYSAEGFIYSHVVKYIQSFKRAGFAVILIVVTEGLNQKLHSVSEEVDGLLIRINHGWDFAAWAAGLAVFPVLWQAKTLILANDSVYGPINEDNFNTIITRVRRSECDVVGLTDSYQVTHHLMSYFTGYTQFGLRKKDLQNFWASVRSISDKQEVINKYELTSSSRLSKAGMTFETLFPTSDDNEKPINPTLDSWRQLLKQGFPFLKVQLLRDQLAGVDASDWSGSLGDNQPLREDILFHLQSVAAKQTRSRQSEFRPIPHPHHNYTISNDLKTPYGATPSTRPTDETDLALEVPFRYDFLPSKIAAVAVIAHIFHADLSTEIRAKLENIPIQADLFISTNSDAKKAEIEQTFSTYENGKVNVSVFPNVGRDIAPMMVGYSEVFNNYEVFLHIHSKKSDHSPNLANWRDFLLTNLLGSKEIVHSVLNLFENTDAGIVYSQHFPPLRRLLNFGGNFDKMVDLLTGTGFKLTKDTILEFPSSSFFWGRTKALKALIDKKLTWDDFPEEAGQIDGTIAHAIERSILYFAETSGMRWAKITTVDAVPGKTLIPVHDREKLEDALLRVHRQLIGNRLRSSSVRNLIGEVNQIGTRPDKSVRPRLNLLLPTLEPAKIFGGITTALRLYRDIAVQLGDEFDLRIISVNEAVTLQCMTSLPDYTLLPLGAISDGFQRTVIDASNGLSGQISLRRNDIFIATAWWTAVNAFSFHDAQSRYFGVAHKVIYLIQDHEPNFYGWSSQFGLARQTYERPESTIALVNSEELSNFLDTKYKFQEQYVIPFEINPSIKNALRATARDKLILIYGRPNTPRNAFQILCSAIISWQQSEPTIAADWKIISVGEQFPVHQAAQVKNLEVFGKLTLEGYAEMLSNEPLRFSRRLFGLSHAAMDCSRSAA